jgi:hypothetical protein
LRARGVSGRKKERGMGDGLPMESGERPMGGGGGGSRCGAADVERPMESGRCGQAGSAKQKQCARKERVRFRGAADGSKARPMGTNWGIGRRGKEKKGAAGGLLADFSFLSLLFFSFSN